MKQCKKCGQEKPETSFPMRFGKDYREHTCGMCKKRAHIARHPETKRLEGYRRAARRQGITLAEYFMLRDLRAFRVAYRNRPKGLVVDGIRVRKSRVRCPLLQRAHDAAKSREYHARHLKKSRNRVRLWKQNNPAKRSAQHYRYRTRFAALQQDLTENQWEAIKLVYGHRCAYCGQRKRLTQDHVVPVSKGGPHTASNIVPACRSCNSSKGPRPPRVTYQPHLIC